MSPWACPIIRTSVDHGTGFALAGKGTSNELSLVNAIDYAIRMANGAAKTDLEPLWLRLIAPLPAKVPPGRLPPGRDLFAAYSRTERRCGVGPE